MVASDTATLGQKELSNKWPVTEGLIAGTTKLSDEGHSLEAEVDLVTRFQ